MFFVRKQHCSSIPYPKNSTPQKRIQALALPKNNRKVLMWKCRKIIRIVRASTWQEDEIFIRALFQKERKGYVKDLGTCIPYKEWEWVEEWV